MPDRDAIKLKAGLSVLSTYIDALCPSERLLLAVLLASLSDDDAQISDVSISWTDIEGGRQHRAVATAPVSN
ncbi:hypothetical protein Hden_1210 [Hyphomicrobium denitrificans ATCC 51888]|uniref:Uncharacterized protein n=1 Tax=Hyphomicrobium denitrificans (strain ATCC 51888 / DSM 1869 / NCIMB 11706 / TK 0415) TaxID=582899 RepID=D8JWA9_HYPDA|nr:hypothetical protein [Hyphomicrobium denitrificans]ADJ23022.1 hypothetical protein Hden_1210 [Hyphomicrobium denitrificans ATCC 51888]